MRSAAGWWCWHLVVLYQIYQSVTVDLGKRFYIYHHRPRVFISAVADLSSLPHQRSPETTKDGEITLFLNREANSGVPLTIPHPNSAIAV